MWIVLFLIAAFVVWHFIPQPDPNRPAPRFRREDQAVESDPDWISFIEAHCESPAETAFLRAMIRACDLKPNDGALAGAGVELDFQTQEGRYRVDFLVNKWLVVEVDGAAWHSSPEAVARDKVRDQFFENLGYTVLRIPAKVVFNQPNDAVQRVRTALGEGKRIMPVPKTGWQRLSETTAAIKEGVSSINAAIAQSSAVLSAIHDAKMSANAERHMILNAMEIAKSELETEDFLTEADDDLKKMLKEADDVFEGVFNESSSLEPLASKIEMRSFPTAPSAHAIPAYDAAIQVAYSKVADERSEFLVTQRAIINSDPRMPSIVKNKLKEMGCSECWDSLEMDGVH